ncbi:MAG TPA: type II secretion system F family protein [Candidatus Hydrogenedentes bacterium]|nr:type II secretion system F family protein [Candidatus Hydrogenedentota bacterium]
MNWKKLLYFDLGRFLPWTKGVETESDRWSDLWFVRMFTWRPRRGPFRRRRKITHFESGEYSPGLCYRMTGKRWKGPLYITAPRWRRDVLYVLDQLTAIVKTNASLIKGLESCAREERRQDRFGTGRRSTYLFQAYGLVVVCMAFFLWLGFSQLDMFERLDPWAVIYFMGISALSIIPGAILRTRSGRLEAVFLTLRDDLSSGMPLSEAVGRLKHMFPGFYADLIKAGEDSGRLGECLDQLAQETVHSFSLGRTVRGHLMYLGLVFLAQVAITTFIYVKCMPVFMEVISDVGGDSPHLVKTINGILEWFYYTWISTPSSNYAPGNSSWHFFLSPISLQNIVLVLIAGGALWFRVRRRTFSTRSLAGIFLVIPWLRGLVIQRNLAVISMVLEKLLSAGVPMDHALEGAAHAELNPLFRRIVVRVHKRILQGESLSGAWAAENRWLARLPGSFLGLMSIGERSGLLPEALKRLGDFYQRSAEQRTRILADALLPFGVLSLGFITLAVELSIFTSLVSIIDSLI